MALVCWLKAILNNSLNVYFRGSSEGTDNSYAASIQVVIKIDIQDIKWIMKVAQRS